MAADYYKILDVPKNSSEADIKKAYRKLAHKYHPDKKGGNEAKFKEVNDAYAVLGDTKKRSEYDQFGQTFGQTDPGAGSRGGGGGYGGGQYSQGAQGFNFDFSSFGGGDGFVESIFENVFGGGFSGSQAKRGGEDMQVSLTITFAEMVSGINKKVHVERLATCDTCSGSGGKKGSKKKTCSTCKGAGEVTQDMRTILGTIRQKRSCPECHGLGEVYEEKCSDCAGSGRKRKKETLEVEVPAGMEDGQALAYRGMGEAGEHGTPAGDLYIVVRVAPDKRFERSGHDIVGSYEASYTELVLGAKVAIETVHGTVTMKIPEGTKPGETFRLREHGLDKGGMWGGKGDHLVRIGIRIPKNVNKKLQKALEELEDLK